MIHVIWDEHKAFQAWEQGSPHYGHYFMELLHQLGFSHTVYSTESWLRRLPPGLTIVLTLDNGTQAIAAIRAYCEAGNGILTIGDTFGLDAVLGVVSLSKVQEGRIDWGDAPVAEGLHSSFRFFGGRLVEPRDCPTVYGELLLPHATGSSYPAYTLRPVQSGLAACLCVDLPRTFILLQQGLPVWKDGLPSPDGSALINDHVLKTDDACLLDWTQDRGCADGEETPFFLHPILDEFRIVLGHLLYSCHERLRLPLAQVWFWPGGLPGIGHISHDTDGNFPTAAQLMLDSLAEAKVRSTWCIIAPGYDRTIMSRIESEGHEPAFHYNALESQGGCWEEAEFVAQLDTIRQTIAIPDPILTNKNHFLRWEGYSEFYEWCERAGIRVEQSRGGTKQGNKGFLCGTCHPFRPVAEGGAGRNRLFPLYSMLTLAWDPPFPLRCTMNEARSILKRSREVYGVAHFLFHPTLIERSPEVKPALLELVDYGRSQGLDWWTSRQIQEWLDARRGVSVRPETGKLVLTSDGALASVTLLLNAPVAELPTVGSVRQVRRFGHTLVELTLDLPAGDTEISLQALNAAAPANDNDHVPVSPV
ncbi:hypothetical protein [Paenibacillus koleovorans]|uniref:hypothetical protein n=1 Tax=Paenibacillus koleovorans TaxID=121608 RepID=UPI000FDB5D22|nr:hypothetical protein [Paenibacillus koleovorans]